MSHPEGSEKGSGSNKCCLCTEACQCRINRNNRGHSEGAKSYQRYLVGGGAAAVMP